MREGGREGEGRMEGRNEEGERGRNGGSRSPPPPVAIVGAVGATQIADLATLCTILRLCPVLSLQLDGPIICFALPNVLLKYLISIHLGHSASCTKKIYNHLN
jgi:hypothetical protein